MKLKLPLTTQSYLILDAGGYTISSCQTSEIAQALAAALNALAISTCPCLEPDAHSGRCGQFLCTCYVSHHSEHAAFKQRVAGTLMDQPCGWPWHAVETLFEKTIRG